MIIKLPRGIEVDINNIPENFDDIIKEAFRQYTQGTAKAYRYIDKLSFIDVCRRLLHNPEDKDSYKQVIELIKEEFARELEENETFMGESDFYSIEFLAYCHEKGANNLNARYTGNRHTDEKIMKLLERVIKVVINYE